MVISDNFDTLNDQYYLNGWTDGLPVVPPTVERVHSFLEGNHYEPDEVIGVEGVFGRAVTAEKLAVNAVMAGCLPAYFPVVVAAARAMCAEEFLLQGATSSTGGSAPMIIVNGPIAQELGMNGQHNVLGNGNRANATIGRAMRFMLINIIGIKPGSTDRATFGHPGKFTLCFAEDEDHVEGWPGLAEERGVKPGGSGVTVMACESPSQLMNEWTEKPEDLLDTYAAVMRSNMLEYSLWAGNYAILVSKQHRALLHEAGWTKEMVRQYIYQSARVRRGEWAKAGKSAVVGTDVDREYAALDSPDDLLVIGAGGPAGGFGVILAPWFGNKSRAVTTEVERR